MGGDLSWLVLGTIEGNRFGEFSLKLFLVLVTPEEAEKVRNQRITSNSC
jgi:hypothetical protein